MTRAPTAPREVEIELPSGERIRILAPGTTDGIGRTFRYVPAPRGDPPDLLVALGDEVPALDPLLPVQRSVPNLCGPEDAELPPADERIRSRVEPRKLGSRSRENCVSKKEVPERADRVGDRELAVIVGVGAVLAA